MKRQWTIILLLIFVFASVSHSSEKAKLTHNAQKDIDNLVKAARLLKTAWPWKGEIPEVNRVTRHGKIVTPALVSLLKVEKEYETEFDLHVEQQIELTLCRIYKEVPESGKTVYGIRSSDSENVKIKAFWVDRIKRDSK